MPTTEIISIGAMEGPFTTRLRHIKHRCDSKIESDKDLFQDLLDHLIGTIIHIGAPNSFEDDPFYTLAGDFYIRNESNKLLWSYKDIVFEEILTLIDSMRDQSPVKHVVFLTDFQFGPAKREVCNLSGVEDFIKLNKNISLRFNTLYSIGGVLEDSKYWDFYE